MPCASSSRPRRRRRRSRRLRSRRRPPRRRPRASAYESLARLEPRRGRDRRRRGRRTCTRGRLASHPRWKRSTSTAARVSPSRFAPRSSPVRGAFCAPRSASARACLAFLAEARELSRSDPRNTPREGLRRSRARPSTRRRGPSFATGASQSLIRAEFVFGSARPKVHSTSAASENALGPFAASDDVLSAACAFNSITPAT
eukprot:30392-Pelagococcus_subviridis.AAC.2